MTAEEIITAIQVAAKKRKGKAPGGEAFLRSVGLSERGLWRVGFRTYSEAVAAAGIKPNVMNPGMSDSDVLNGLAELVLRIERFPTKADISLARIRGDEVVSYAALLRRRGDSIVGLREVFATFAQSHARVDELSAILGLSEVAGERDFPVLAPSITGYVYLLKSNKDYKIGRSNDVARRRREVSLLLPRELEHVHVIETDDPEGIERYWHQRFADRRTRGEWFALTPEDVRAFRRRRFQ